MNVPINLPFLDGPPTDRITFTYLDGPLAGHVVQHALRPVDPAALLYQATQRAKGGSVKYTAQGQYRLEERKRPLPEIELPPEPPTDASEEVRAQMLAARAQVEGVIAQTAAAQPAEWVAIHHPSADDKEWHIKPPKEKAEVEEEPKPPKPKREPIQLPDSHPVMKRFAPYVEALKALHAAEQAQKQAEQPPSSDV